RHLRNAPITEAIIDFRVKAKPSFRAESFSTLVPRLAGRFPKHEARRGMEASFQVVGGIGHPPTVQHLGLQGYFFKSADEKSISQFRVDVFTFNRLRPYTSWDEIIPVAIELWGMYCNVAQPEVATRLAVRYINHIPLPASLTDFAQYLTAAPV